MAELKKSAISEWESHLHALLPVFGHRNWIVVADSAYPAQSKPGIETIAVGGGQIETLKKVHDAIAACKHVRANVYVDRELTFVSEKDAPGVRSYRRKLKALQGESATELAHEEIIARLDQSAEVFRILILKTEMTIPYTSVFFELDCGYWTAAAEKRLRQAIEASNHK